jgi:CBS domain-containing protein
MVATGKSLYALTAADLMTRVGVALRQWQSLREAAEELFRAGVHGAPVVDASGKCVGVLSVTDLARWAARRVGAAAGRPRACPNQKTYRRPGGEEVTLCALPAGRCPLQAPTEVADGHVAQECRDPHGVCLEWQMVELDALPADDVRHYMTEEPVTVDPGSPIRLVARRMLEEAVQRVIVVDSAGDPVGVVSATDLVAAVAEADEDTAG